MPERFTVGAFGFPSYIKHETRQYWKHLPFLAVHFMFSESL